MIKKINKILSLRQKASFVLMTVLLFMGGLFDLLGVALILPIVNLIVDEGRMREQQWIRTLIDVTHIEDLRHVVILLLAAMIAVYVVKNLYIMLMYKMIYHFTYAFKRELSLRLLHCYMFQDYTFHLKKNVAELQRNILTDTGQFFGFISDFMNCFNQCVVCLLLGIYLFVVDWQTALGAIFVLGFGVFFVYGYQKRKQVERGIANRNAAADLNKWVIQSFAGIKEIQVLGREEFFLARCVEAYDRGAEANKKSNFASVIPKPLMEMVFVGGLLGIVLIKLLSGAEMSRFVSILSVFAVAAFRMLPCFNSISAYVSNMLFEKESVDAVYYDIVEMEELGERKGKSAVNERLAFRDEIQIKNLSYKYPGTDTWILKNVNLTIKKNQSVGFMGTSGAGKSTLIDIVLGVLPIKYGEIIVDGVNVRDRMDAWHRLIGYIPQAIYLMDDTIRNNVAFGIPKEEISEEKLWKALEDAQIADFIRELPEGLDSQIGDRGVRISGGQRQRLGIARALYHEPEILVFDEATSALDNETEAALMEAIDGLKGSRTILIIAHRLKTIEKCDVRYEVGNQKVSVVHGAKPIG